jgi:hypothetical protein
MIFFLEKILIPAKIPAKIEDWKKFLWTILGNQAKKATKQGGRDYRAIERKS